MPPLTRLTPCPLAMLMVLATATLIFAQTSDSLESSSNAPAKKASKPDTEDSWIDQRDEQTGLLVRTRELTLHPQPEPKPALKHRLLPDEFDRVPGNAAIFYLKAMGFLEQNQARELLFQYRKEALAEARKKGQGPGQAAPYVWLNMPPSQLPVDEVKKYLQLLAFQPAILSEGARRDRFDMDRNFKNLNDPIAYLLPEIQNLREVARMQSLRCRLAIAEGRVDDAIAITGQQFAMARHLGQDDFLVSNLVGIAIANIAWNDALYLVELADTPNLYWALATMPDPLVNMKHSMSIERQFLYQQVKVLREVNETPRPAGYWQEFIDRLLPQIGMLASELNTPMLAENPEDARAMLVAYVAASYPGARDYLLNELKMPKDQVDAYPTAQVVFLAMVRFYDQHRDDVFKWQHIPFWQAHASTAAANVNQSMARQGDRYGWFVLPTQALLPAIRAARTAEARCQQCIALLQTIEAIRMYAATHDGQLPPSLGALSIPAPVEPFTGKSIDYQVINGRAVLNGHAFPGMRYRLILRIAQ